MQILVNSNNSVNTTEGLIQKVSDKAREVLERHADRITRVEIYLADVNSSDKSGPADKYCSIEARVKGFDPVGTTHQASDLDLAVDGALEKLEKLISRSLDKQDHKKGRTPMGGEPFADAVDSDSTI